MRRKGVFAYFDFVVVKRINGHKLKTLNCSETVFRTKISPMSSHQNVFKKEKFVLKISFEPPARYLWRMPSTIALPKLDS